MIENAGEITSAFTRRAIVERFSAAAGAKPAAHRAIPLEAIRRIAKPTPAQVEAGNYQKAHVRLHGLDIAIECRKGARRRPEWPPLAAHYGYIKRTAGNDGDHLDVFVGPTPESEFVVIVDQISQGRQFDEHKVLLGFVSRSAAIEAYRASYTPGWRLGPVTTMTMDQFKRWLADGCQRTPAAVQVSKFAANESETTVGKFGDRGRYVTTEDGAKIFLTTDGQIGRTGKSIGGDGPASPERPAEPELRPGQKLTVPTSTSFGEFRAKLTDEGDGRLGLHRDEEKSYPIVKFNPEKMRTLLDDLSGKIRLPGPTGNPSIDRVAAGQAKFLGRGNDGLAFDTGDGNVVKVSSQFYFHWMQGSREPHEAIEHTRRGYEIGTKLREIGVPGIIPQQYFEHGGRSFLTMPKLDTSATITPEHVEQVRQTVKEMLDAGYGLNDEIQVGIGQDGRAYVFDLGQAGKIESKHQRENNEEAFQSFAKKHGVVDVDVDAASRFDEAMSEAENYVDKWEKRGYVPPPIVRIILDKLGSAWSKAIKAAPEMTELYEDAYFGIVHRLDAIPTTKPTAPAAQ